LPSETIDTAVDVAQVAPESEERKRWLSFDSSLSIAPRRVPEAFRKETSRQSFAPMVERVEVAQVEPESMERYTWPTPVGNAAILVPPDEIEADSQTRRPAEVDVAQVEPESVDT
jgi:hypothetical protein